jgi:hypothetical protein
MRFKSVATLEAKYRAWVRVKVMLSAIVVL